MRTWLKYKNLPVDCSASTVAIAPSKAQGPVHPYLARIYMIPVGGSSRDELKQYVDEPVEVNPHLDVLDFLRRNKTTWPRLASVAKDYL